MLQRILGAVLAVAGLAAIAFGVATATVLRESDTVVATARPVGDGTLVVTDPGVLDLVDADVTVTASVPAGQEVTVVVGRDVDVLGWLDGDPYTRVTGLADWDTLATSAVTAENPDEDVDEEAAEDAEASEEAEEVELPDPAGSDMWITELTAADEVTLRWNDRPGPWMLLAAGTGAAPAEATEDDDAEATEGEAAADEEAPAADEASDADAVAPTLELTWDREVSTPLLWPAVGLGGLLLVAGVVLLLAGGRKRKSTRGRGSAVGAVPGSASPAASPVVASDSPSETGSAASPGSHFGPTAAGGVSAWSEPTGGPTWPAEVDSPEPAHTTVSPDLPAPGTSTDADPAQDPDDEEGAGTAPVPVAGRFSRRSRLRRTRSAPETSPTDGEYAPSGVAPAPEPWPTEPPATTTGSLPMLPDGRPLTRRELRRLEEERRAGERSGMSRALRALTGQTPVVPPADALPAAGEDVPPAASGRRAAAWRETWGFDAGAGGQDTSQHDSTDGGTR